MLASKQWPDDLIEILKHCLKADHMVGFFILLYMVERYRKLLNNNVKSLVLKGLI
jgi:hypothetical protein